MAGNELKGDLHSSAWLQAPYDLSSFYEEQWNYALYKGPYEACMYILQAFFTVGFHLSPFKHVQQRNFVSYSF